MTAPEVQKVQPTGSTARCASPKAFPQDPRGAPVLTNAAEKLYALNDGTQAAAVAHRYWRCSPPRRRSSGAWPGPSSRTRRSSKGEFVDAERAYGEVLALTPEKDAARATSDRAARRLGLQAGRGGARAGPIARSDRAYTRVASVAPQSPVRATAQYDAAAAMLTLKDWDGAARRWRISAAATRNIRCRAT